MKKKKREFSEFSKEAAKNGYVDAEQMIEMMEDIVLIPKEEAIEFLDNLIKKEEQLEKYKAECIKYIVNTYGEEMIPEWNQIVTDDDIMFAINNNTSVKAFVEGELY